MMSSSLGGGSGFKRTGVTGVRLKIESKIRAEVSPRKGSVPRGLRTEGLAKPHSSTLVVPRLVTKMLAGLMSRCKMPLEWAA
jgi:hypothetical protein